MEFKKKIIDNTHFYPTRPYSASSPSKLEQKKRMKRSKSFDCNNFKAGLRSEEEDEIIITGEILEDLLSNLTLAEIEEIQTENGLEEKELESSDNYFEAFGSPEQLAKLSPWTPNGPILKSTPSFSEMSVMIKNGSCTCLLLHCDEEVLTGKIKPLAANPWYFMCRSHRKAVTKKYGYGSKKIL